MAGLAAWLMLRCYLWVVSAETILERIPASLARCPMNAQPNTGMKPTTFDNPMGIDGFEFVEFAAPAGQAHQLHDYFRKLGFVQVARYKTRPISTYRQGDCTFLINEDPDSFAARFAAQHGPSACGF